MADPGALRGNRAYHRDQRMAALTARYGLGVNDSVDSTSAAAAYVLSGTVTATPAYPGPQRIDTPSHRPVAGATVTLSAASATVATTTTDDAGRFSLTVPPGRYDLAATGTGYRSQAGQPVTVAEPTTVTLVVDSGMR